MEFQCERIKQDVEKALTEIQAVDVTNPTNVISSERGTCRYSKFEHPLIRKAKYNKIQEVIKYESSS